MLLSEVLGTLVKLNGGDREIGAEEILEVYSSLRKPNKPKYTRRNLDKLAETLKDQGIPVDKFPPVLCKPGENLDNPDGTPQMPQPPAKVRRPRSDKGVPRKPRNQVSSTPLSQWGAPPPQS